MLADGTITGRNVADVPGIILMQQLIPFIIGESPLGLAGILIGKTDFLINMVVGHVIHAFEAGETVDGVIIELVFEIQRSQQFQHVGITCYLGQRQTIGHIQSLVIHHRNEFPTT